MAARAEGWDIRAIKTLEPTADLSSDGPAEEMIGALARALRAHGYAVRPRGDARFKARKRDWLDIARGLVVGGGNRATAYVHVEAQGPHSVRIRLRPTHAPGPNAGIVPAINGAIAALERDGRRVTITPWARR